MESGNTVVTYISAAGVASSFDVAAGTSIMEAAVDNDVEGIDGQCGGRLVCGTCHVFVEQLDGPELAGPDLDEDELLDYTAEPRAAESRLSCQITTSADLKSLLVRLPKEQK